MLDAKSIQISKMNCLAHAVALLIHNNDDTEAINLKDVVETAERLTSWVLNPRLKYVTENAKETK